MDIDLFIGSITACGILVPQTGTEPVPSVVEVQRPNHWTARTVPSGKIFLNLIFFFLMSLLGSMPHYAAVFSNNFMLL